MSTPIKAPENIAVRCVNIRKSYGTGAAGVDALRGVNLDLYSGELLLLVGPSGCGKTTLISIIAAILEQDEGECLVLGQNLRALTSLQKAEFRAGQIGFVFQVFNLLPALSITENVSVPLMIRGVERKAAEQRAIEALNIVELGKRTQTLPAQLSGGQQQRVAIARALVGNPQLVICDEPTSALDHATGQRVMSLLKEKVKNERRTVIVVTHDPRVYDYADRIAYMDDGRIVKIEGLTDK